MHILQSPLFDFEAFIKTRGNDRLTLVLEALPAEKLLIALEKGRWTDRKGYSVHKTTLMLSCRSQCNYDCGQIPFAPFASLRASSELAEGRRRGSTGLS